MEGKKINGEKLRKGDILTMAKSESPLVLDEAFKFCRLSYLKKTKTHSKVIEPNDQRSGI